VTCGCVCVDYDYICGDVMVVICGLCKVMVSGRQAAQGKKYVDKN